MRICKGAERPCREWWAVLGTVTEASDGLGSWTLGVGAGAVDVETDPGRVDACEALSFLKYEGGKCFSLYFSCTPSSNCEKSGHVKLLPRLK
jgi:hypothetical protein